METTDYRQTCGQDFSGGWGGTNAHGCSVQEHKTDFSESNIYFGEFLACEIYFSPEAVGRTFSHVYPLAECLNPATFVDTRAASFYYSSNQLIDANNQL